MLTVNQYKKAIATLSPKRKEILLKLYKNGPFDYSNLIAAVLGYKGFGAANLHIGNIGKQISEVSKVTSSYHYAYKGGERLAYFQFVHRYTEDGWDLVSNLQIAIEQLGWRETLINDGKDRLPTEETFVTRSLVREGAVIQVLVNGYERDSSVRKKAEKLHGRTCFGCQINFKTMYGNDIIDIIQFHHVRPLSNVKKEEIKRYSKGPGSSLSQLPRSRAFYRRATFNKRVAKPG